METSLTAHYSNFSARFRIFVEPRKIYLVSFTFGLLGRRFHPLDWKDAGLLFKVSGGITLSLRCCSLTFFHIFSTFFPSNLKKLRNFEWIWSHRLSSKMARFKQYMCRWYTIRREGKERKNNFWHVPESPTQNKEKKRYKYFTYLHIREKNT